MSLKRKGFVFHQRTITNSKSIMVVYQYVEVNQLSLVYQKFKVVEATECIQMGKYSRINK